MHSNFADVILALNIGAAVVNAGITLVGAFAVTEAGTDVAGMAMVIVEYGGVVTRGVRTAFVVTIDVFIKISTFPNVVNKSLDAAVVKVVADSAGVAVVVNVDAFDSNVGVRHLYTPSLLGAAVAAAEEFARE